MASLPGDEWRLRPSCSWGPTGSDRGNFELRPRLGLSADVGRLRDPNYDRIVGAATPAPINPSFFAIFISPFLIRHDGADAPPEIRSRHSCHALQRRFQVQFTNLQNPLGIDGDQPPSYPSHQRVKPEDGLDKRIDRGGQVVETAGRGTARARGRRPLCRTKLLRHPVGQQQHGTEDAEHSGLAQHRRALRESRSRLAAAKPHAHRSEPAPIDGPSDRRSPRIHTPTRRTESPASEYSLAAEPPARSSRQAEQVRSRRPLRMKSRVGHHASLRRPSRHAHKPPRLISTPNPTRNFINPASQTQYRVRAGFFLSSSVISPAAAANMVDCQGCAIILTRPFAPAFAYPSAPLRRPTASACRIQSDGPSRVWPVRRTVLPTRRSVRRASSRAIAASKILALPIRLVSRSAFLRFRRYTVVCMVE